MRQPRLRIRIRPSRFRSGRLGRRSSPAKRFDVPHELPALGFRKLRPNRHPLSNDSIRQDPENSAWRGVLNFRSAEAWPLLAAARSVTMTFSAALFKKNGTRGNGVGIILQWICAVPRFFGCLLQFRIDGRIVLRLCARTIDSARNEVQTASAAAVTFICALQKDG